MVHSFEYYVKYLALVWPPLAAHFLPLSQPFSGSPHKQKCFVAKSTILMISLVWYDPYDVIQTEEKKNWKLSTHSSLRFPDE